MQSPPILDFDRILEPIHGDAPTGVDPRSQRGPTSLYDKCRDARNEAKAAENPKSGMEGEEAELPNWQPVLDFGIQLLEDSAKDLEIAVYVLEGLTRTSGLPGLRDGFRLVREYCDRFWDELHPKSGRLKFDAGLTSQLDPIRTFPVTDAKSGGNHKLSQYLDSVTLEGASDERRKKRIEDGILPLDVLTLGAKNSAKDFYPTLDADLTQTEAEFAQLVQTLNAKLGGDSPSLVALKNLLDTYHKGVVRLAGDKLKPPPLAVPVGVPGEAAAPAPGAVVTNFGVSGVLSSRADAFRTLAQVADFFEATEPQGFTYYALRQVIRWGEMPLPKLLEELITDQGALAALFTRVGIRPETPSETSSESEYNT